jgi:hypothetical protein
MKRIYFALLFVFLTITINAEERFSLQTKPLLYFIPGLQNIYIYTQGVERYWEPLIIIDIEFQYSLNDYLALSINPVFAQGFWKSVQLDYPVGGPGAPSAGEYWSSNCLDFTAGVLFFPIKTGLRGLYLGTYFIIGYGYILYNYYEYYDEYDDKKIHDFLNLGYIVEAGYQWIFNNGFTISLAAGISKLYQIPKIPPVLMAVNSPTIGNDYYSYGNIHGLHFLNLPIDPCIKFSIGYSF